MYYHLSDHIYLAQFQDELIILDTKKDQYTIGFKHLSFLIDLVLTNTFKSQETCKEHFIIESLLKDGILIKSFTQYPYYIDVKSNSSGVSNVDWRLPSTQQPVKFNWLNLWIIFSNLIQINYYMKTKGFYRTIHFLKKTHRKKLNYIIPTEKDSLALALHVNKACSFYPSRIKCLEWALTYVLTALKQGWKCNIEIGIQNYPFMAHAWVECNGKVIMDDPSLRDKLAIILGEPFRRVRE